MNDLVKAIDRARERRGYTRYRLAKMAGIPYQTLLNVENGNNARMDTVLRLCDALRLRLRVVDVATDGN